MAKLKAKHASKILEDKPNSSVASGSSEITSGPSTSGLSDKNKVPPDALQTNKDSDKQLSNVSSPEHEQSPRSITTKISSIFKRNRKAEQSPADDSSDSDSHKSVTSENESFMQSRTKKAKRTHVDSSNGENHSTVNSKGKAPLKKKDLMAKGKGDERVKTIDNTLLEISTIPVLDIPAVKCSSEFETYVVTQMALLHGNIERMESKQDDLSNFLIDKEITKANKESAIDFNRKYNISLPISQKDVFVAFDERLKSNNFLKSDVISALDASIDRVNFSIAKTYLAMLRNFLTKEVVIQYTASRLSKDKENPKAIFKSTEFYQCMQTLILTARKKRTLPTSEKDLIPALSDVLTNAKRWGEKK